MGLIRPEKCDHVCPTDGCDTFQFMAKVMGLRVLHPGGLQATLELARLCEIDENTKVLDVGCGSGSSSIFLTKKYGCRVLGVDMDERLLRKAEETCRRESVQDKVFFRLADIHDLPFDDGVFDGAVAQAVLVFTDKSRVLRELARVVRPGGFVGAVELAWKQVPTSTVLRRVREVLCSAAINAELHRDWIKIFREACLRVSYSELRDLRFSFRDMFRDEGRLTAIRVALKTLFNASARGKMREISSLPEETQKYLGYGLYVGRVS